jgi:hypothetical protein
LSRKIRLSKTNASNVIIIFGYFISLVMYSYTIIDTGIIIVTRNSNAVSLDPVEAKLTTEKPANAPARIRRTLAT